MCYCLHMYVINNSLIQLAGESCTTNSMDYHFIKSALNPLWGDVSVEENVLFKFSPSLYSYLSLSKYRKFYLSSKYTVTYALCIAKIKYQTPA